MDTIYTTFWSESFWFPANVTWKHFESDGDLHIPRPRELFFIFPLALVLYFARIVWERYVAIPIGRHYGVSERPAKKPFSSPLLEESYKKHGRSTPKHNILMGLAKQLDLSERQIERWWRRRRLVSKPTEMTRFCETSWRFLFYTSIFWYGIWAMWDKPWFWETKLCYVGWPRVSIDPEIWWHYQITLAFYISLIMSLMKDNHRSDFWEMNIHHACTVWLLSMSWCINMTRIGSIVIVVHDAADPLLEGAKLLKYLSFKKACDVMFVAFAFDWLLTRLLYYPFVVLYSAILESWWSIGPYPSYYPFMAMLIILQFLHIFWFYLILKMFYQFIVVKGINKDVRSDTEDNDSSEETTHCGENPTSANHSYGEANNNARNK